MAIWSLTQERVDKLLKQIADKEIEIDKLIKLTPKDLWNKDLDDFIAEWHNALNEEKDRAKKIRGMGRRASAKLGIGAGPAKGRKRKAGGSDGSDSDFAVSKKKQPTTKAKAASTLMSFFNQPTAPKAAVNEKPKPRPTKDVKMVDALGSDTDDEIAQVVAIKKPPKAVTKPKPLPPPNPAAPSPSDDDDIFTAVANEAKSSKPAPPQPARQARAATKKVAKYVLSDDSDDNNGDDMLGDVSMMVKGIGSNGDASANRPLFSATAQRPGSSNGLVKTKGRVSKVIDISDGEDETDYTKLIPQGSPQRPAPRTANDTIVHDDDDEAFGVTMTKVSTKMKSTANGASKTAPKPTTKKTAAPKPAPQPKTQITLSPAAKAYAAKQAKVVAPPKALSKKKKVDSDEEMNDLANDLLSDEDGEASNRPAPRAARAGRRAVAARTKYVVSDDSESEEGSDANFDDDDSE